MPCKAVCLTRSRNPCSSCMFDEPGIIGRGGLEVSSPGRKSLPIPEHLEGRLTHCFNSDLTVGTVPIWRLKPFLYSVVRGQGLVSWEKSTAVVQFSGCATKPLPSIPVVSEASQVSTNRRFLLKPLWGSGHSLQLIFWRCYLGDEASSMLWADDMDIDIALQHLYAKAVSILIVPIFWHCFSSLLTSKSYKWEARYV
jgi:hypothetical protein